MKLHVRFGVTHISPYNGLLKSYSSMYGSKETVVEFKFIVQEKMSFLRDEKLFWDDEFSDRMCVWLMQYYYLHLESIAFV